MNKKNPQLFLRAIDKDLQTLGPVEVDLVVLNFLRIDSVPL